MDDLDEKILNFIKKHGAVRWSELKKEILGSTGCAPSTFTHHVRRLLDSKEVKKRLDKSTGWPVYFVPRKHKKKPKLPMAKVKLEDGVKKTYVIAAYAKMNPHIKYSAIADKFGVKGTPEQKKSYVKMCVHRLKQGEIKLTREQVKRIAAEYA